MIQALGLTKLYGKTVALRDLWLEVQPGELFGFLGPNGAGKTTTIKMLVGLARPSEGRAVICGHDANREPMAAKRLVGYVPDRAFLYDKLTGREYLRFVASLYRVPPQQADARAEELLDMFDMTERADKYISSYSHGMKQKVALAGALLHRPRALFLDEPTVGLDPRSAKAMRELLRGLCDTEGMAVFLSTHILEVAERMCDRVGILDRGRLVASGTMAELRHGSATQGDAGTLESIFLELTSPQ